MTTPAPSAHAQRRAPARLQPSPRMHSAKHPPTLALATPWPKPMPPELHAMAQGALNAARQILFDERRVPFVYMLWNGTSPLLPVSAPALAAHEPRERNRVMLEARCDAFEHIARWAVVMAPSWEPGADALLLYCEADGAGWTGRAPVLRDGPRPPVLSRILFTGVDVGLGLWPLLPANYPAHMLGLPQPRP